MFFRYFQCITILHDKLWFNLIHWVPQTICHVILLLKNNDELEALQKYQLPISSLLPLRICKFAIHTNKGYLQSTEGIMVKMSLNFLRSCVHERIYVLSFEIHFIPANYHKRFFERIPLLQKTPKTDIKSQSHENLKIVNFPFLRKHPSSKTRL